MGFNKGEWSEVYTFLHLLISPNMDIVDENLTSINREVFQVVELQIDEKKYQVLDDRNITKILKNGVNKVYLFDNLKEQRAILLNSILSHKKGKGSFEIEEIEPFVDDFFDGKKPKGSSRVKGDLKAKVLDSKQNRTVKLKYNIKSNLGSSPTVLNASRHTNFIFEVQNINDAIMKKNNAINSRKKLIEKSDFLLKEGASFDFIKTESSVFENNLKLIDSKLDEILAQMLLLSYEKNEKDIEKLLAFIIKDEVSKKFYKKKIGDFANAVTFGMRASEVWSGENEVNGGILLVTKKGEVLLLDLIYFKEVVDKYLINNIKLESPSSTRYKMFEIYKEDNRYYFKLNLQIRFK